MVDLAYLLPAEQAENRSVRNQFGRYRGMGEERVAGELAQLLAAVPRRLRRALGCTGWDEPL
jgi:negative regulator of sigma E activity